MNVFVDANIIVSGIVFNGKEHKLLLKGLSKRTQLITSEDVLDEVVGVLNKKFPEHAGLVKEFLRLIRVKISLRGDYEKSIKAGIVRDEADAHVLAAALETKCSVIVTGDRDLLALGRYHGIKIKTTSQFLKDR